MIVDRLSLLQQLRLLELPLGVQILNDSIRSCRSSEHREGFEDKGNIAMMTITVMATIPAKWTEIAATTASVQTLPVAHEPAFSLLGGVFDLLRAIVVVEE